MRPPPLLPAPAARLTAYAAFALAGALEWQRLLATGSVPRALGWVLAGLVAGLLVARARRADGEPSPLRLVGALVGSGALALVLSGLALGRLAPGAWGELVPGVAGGAQALSTVTLPYGGADPWVVAVVELSGAGLCWLAGVLAAWPRGGAWARTLALVVLLVLAISPTVSVGAEHATLLGAALTLLVAAFLWLERVARRGVAGLVVLAAAAVAVAVPLGGAADRDTAWFDYQAFSERFGAGSPIDFDWTQRYDGIDWPREGAEMLRARTTGGRPVYLKTEQLDHFDGRGGWTVGSGGVQELPSAGPRRPEWDVRVAVTVRRLATVRVPAPGVTTAVESATEPVEPDVVPGPWTTAVGRELAAGDSYVVSARVPDPTAAELEGATVDGDPPGPPALAADVGLPTPERLLGDLPPAVRARIGDPFTDSRVQFPPFRTAGEGTAGAAGGRRSGATPPSEGARPTVADPAGTRPSGANPTGADLRPEPRGEGRSSASQRRRDATRPGPVEARRRGLGRTDPAPRPSPASTLRRRAPQGSAVASGDRPAPVGTTSGRATPPERPVATLRTLGVDVPAARLLAGSELRRTWALSQRLRARSRTPYDYVLQVSQALKAPGFRYTEQPPATTGQPLEAFLFDTRAGYCQHYAGAMALLLRMGGVPARVVTGFSPGGRRDATGEWVVRDTDGHAWVEAWFDGIGWVTFDPTPPATPARNLVAAVGTPTPAPAAAAATPTAASGTDPLARRPEGSRIEVAPTAAPAADSSGDGPPWPLLGLGTALLAAAGVTLARLRRRPRDAAGERALAELERAWRRSGRTVAPGQTLSALERTLGGGAEASAYLRALRDARYRGTRAPAPTAAQRAALRRELSAGLGPLGRARAWFALPPRPGVRSRSGPGSSADRATAS